MTAFRSAYRAHVGHALGLDRDVDPRDCNHRGDRRQDDETVVPDTVRYR